MLDVKTWKRVHLIGIGGINMSAVAKLLVKAGVKVTGSDVVASEITAQLAKLGVAISIGAHDERNVPADCQGVIHTSAAPEENPERVAAKHRGLPDVTNFEWLGSWFKGKKIVLVTGTHGKSTTTALLGEMCRVSKLDPTVIVGSKVPGWIEENLLIGSSDLVIIEGDEYAKHFLEFHPDALIITNIELDHTDVYKDLDDVRKTFEKLLHQTKQDGVVVANGESTQAREALKSFIATKRLKPIFFGIANKSKTDDTQEVGLQIARRNNETEVGIEYGTWSLNLESSLMGNCNGMNVASAALMAHALGATDQAIVDATKSFNGIWRRMELVTIRDGVSVYSDYGHHPTAVRAMLDAIREAFPDKRIVLCFQPHHKNRTKALFDEFVTCFDRADVLILCEIYDVPGRSAPEDADMTSQKLLEAVKKHDVARPLSQMEYAVDPAMAVKRTLENLKSGDICVFMGAGDIDVEVRRILE